MALGQPPNPKKIEEAVAVITNRTDGADFLAHALLRMYHSEKPALPAVQKGQIKKALLGFKYWADEPGGKDLLSTWSENHQINYHGAQYLAGELFADETFTNNGQKGAWHRERGKKRVLAWIDIKAKTGFLEWDSNNCYINTSAALMNLAELAQDQVVRKRAAMLLDIMFLDIAVDSFRGSYGTAHGRTYPRAITAGGATEDTAALQRIAFGLGAIGKPDNNAAIYLASSKRYRVARTIELIGQHLPRELTNRERQSIRVEDDKRFGLDFDDPEDFFLLHEGGKASSIDHIERSLKVTDNLNFYRYGLVMRPWIVAVLETYRALQKAGQPIPDLDNSSTATIDKITFRTPDYQLSTAQAYRAGAPGSQQHIWQATLGPNTQVFTMHPGGSKKYWQGRLPRNGQHRNLLVAMYRVPEKRPPGPKTILPKDAGGDAVPSPAPSEEPLLPYTVAIFRRTAFDEVVEKNGWTFGQYGHAYLALWSEKKAEWSADGVVDGEGLIAQGRENTWICQLGREEVDGPFDKWVARIAAAPVSVKGDKVSYRAPGLGQVSFGWQAPLRVGGKNIPLSDYPRFDNPYTRAPYGKGRYVIRHAGHQLTIDFAKNQHQERIPKRR